MESTRSTGNIFNTLFNPKEKATDEIATSISRAIEVVDISYKEETDKIDREIRTLQLHRSRLLEVTKDAGIQKHIEKNEAQSESLVTDANNIRKLR